MRPIGRDRATALALEAMGARHLECSVRETIVDRRRKIVTTTAYMLAERIGEAAEGIDRAVVRAPGAGLSTSTTTTSRSGATRAARTGRTS
jgi:enhancing lycopene biosynthesis protein 2